jgi:hypothetical protein
MNMSLARSDRCTSWDAEQSKQYRDAVDSAQEHSRQNSNVLGNGRESSYEERRMRMDAVIVEDAESDERAVGQCAGVGPC